MKNVLILGATGAMAKYLIPLLLENGMKVTGVSLVDMVSDNENLEYIKADAKNPDFTAKLLERGFDTVVDYMIYKTPEEFLPFMNLFLSKTEHYIFLSSYRVYGGGYPITEQTPRLWDDLPEGYVTELEYSIYKAREEDMLRASGKSNYTIVRPAVTYSKGRLQLVTLEAEVHVLRALNGKTVVLPEEAMDIQGTMSWAGDAAKMFLGVIQNKKSLGETYTFSTSEHHSWREIAEIYKKECGMNYITVPAKDFLEIIKPGNHYGPRQQLFNDRCYNRIIDNSKILDLCGLKQSEFMPLADGIKLEFEWIKKNGISASGEWAAINERMDKYLEGVRI